VIVMVLVAPGLARGGDKPDKEPTPRPIGGLSFADEVDVTVVNIDVYVRTKKGEPVKDLAVEDFVVHQDGIPRELTNFAILDQEIFRNTFEFRPDPVPEATPPPELEELKERIRPIFLVIYVDNENINPLRRNKVLRNVRTFVTENLREPIQVMVVS
jgi:hypothetical protein